MSTIVSDEQIRAMLETKVKAVVGVPPHTDGKEPKVYPWNPLKPLGVDEKEKARVLGEWANLFRYTDDSGDEPVEKLCGVVIKRASIESNLRGDGCEDFFPVYDFWVFYGFRVGTRTSNSDIEFNRMIDLLRSEFNSGENAGFLEIDDVFVPHKGLQFPPQLTLLPCGETSMHFGAGFIQFDFSS
ncbi:MAG: hypothetical protein WA584_23360 [Pyrinomonadaceae bacterium]